MIYFFNKNSNPEPIWSNIFLGYEAEKIIKEEVLSNIFDLQSKNNKIS